VLWAEEDDASAPIDWSRRITAIETFSPAFHTAEGVRPGSLVSHVETVFCKTKEIVESEIESRQYIVFESQPAFARFRLDYTGVFSSGGTTREFKPGARILSIAISSH
jgi:hypothetical protein